MGWKALWGDQELFWRTRSCWERERDALFEKIILLIFWKGNPLVLYQCHLHRHCLVSLLSLGHCPHARVWCLQGLWQIQPEASFPLAPRHPWSVYWCYRFLLATVSQFLLQTVSATVHVGPCRWRALSLRSTGKGQQLRGGLWIPQIPPLVMWRGINLWPRVSVLISHLSYSGLLFHPVQYKPFPLASCKPKPRLDDFHRATHLRLVGNTPWVALGSEEGAAEGAARGEAVVRPRPLSLYRGDGTGGAVVVPSVSPLFLAQKRDSHRGKRLILPVSCD